MYTTTLADPARLQQFALLCGTVRPFQRHVVHHDENDKAWACARINGQLFAVPAARLQKALAFGRIAERVIWLIHVAVRNQRIPQVHFPKKTLYELVWGVSFTRRSPQTLRKTLKGLAELCVGEWPPDQEVPPLAQSRPLFEQINAESDRFVFVVGEGLLGSLEQFAVQDDGELLYKFPNGKQLKGLRKEQRVQDVYLPIYLGDFVACKRFTPRQKRLFQAVINEVTCPPKSKEHSDSKRLSRTLEQALVISGGKVVGYNGSGTTECPYLETPLHYVGFNGNGVRRGCGYKLRTWMKKAGYQDEEVLRFLDDLALLSHELGLIVAAVRRGNDNWCPLSRVVLLARTDGGGWPKLDIFHIRVYAKADCFERWDRLFQWDSTPGMAIHGNEVKNASADVAERLRESLRAGGLQQQEVVARLRVSKQHLSAVLRGKKRCSNKLTKQIEKYLASHTKSSVGCATKSVEKPQFELVNVQVKEGSATMREAALDYYDRGLCVIPIRSWKVSRQPFVKWKPYQTKRPTRQQVIEWWTKWPDAGIAVILGSISNLLCADVDGEEAHRILLDILGEIPLAPTCKSGSDDPFRYHLYFQHPKQLATAASKTPFNQPDDKGKLELRGDMGLLVLPPSRHKSGRRYAWVNGRSLDDVAFPELPDVLLEALETALKPLTDTMEPDVLPATAAPANKTAGHAVIFDVYHVAPSTARFLSGQHAESTGWNQRLFRAACDLSARGVPRSKADKLLLHGAKPKTADDGQAARDTIVSAYSKPRTPSRF